MMRAVGIYLLCIALLCLCVGVFVAPLVKVSETITWPEARRFLAEFTPVILAAAALMTAPWVSGKIGPR